MNHSFRYAGGTKGGRVQKCKSTAWMVTAQSTKRREKLKKRTSASIWRVLKLRSGRGEDLHSHSTYLDH